MSLNNEQQLLQLLKTGNASALKGLYSLYAEKVYYFSFRYLRNSADSEEIVQEAFLKIWVHRNEIDESQSFNNYLFTITRNIIFNQYRKKINESAYIEYLKPLINDLDSSTEDTIDSNDLSDFLYQQIDKLPPQRKLIFKKSRVEGLTYPQIAAELNISEKTVESQIRLALQTLRKEMK